ncbi:hypothetical protein M2351_000579 [Azospirillum canadense]|nr:hypothetical protein [Azospirillum canadense]
MLELALGNSIFPRDAGKQKTTIQRRPDGWQRASPSPSPSLCPAAAGPKSERHRTSANAAGGTTAMSVYSRFALKKFSRLALYSWNGINGDGGGGRCQGGSGAAH